MLDDVNILLLSEYKKSNIFGFFYSAKKQIPPKFVVHKNIFLELIWKYNLESVW